MSKACINCKVVKPLEDFYRARSMADGRLGRCKPCHIDGQRGARYARVYGITRERFEELLEAQGGRCAICSCKPSERLHVDHNHETGAVRGLLCRKCNTLLGNAKDNPAVLLAAAQYLRGPLI